MSAAEDLLAVQLDQAGIPFEREFRFHPTRRWRADFVIHDDGYGPIEYAPSRDMRSILVEVDGGAFIGGRHSTGVGVEKDAEKASAAAILGYRVIRVTPRHVNDGTALTWIKQALGLEEAA
jgi:hypothetical protein